MLCKENILCNWTKRIKRLFNILEYVLCICVLYVCECVFIFVCVRVCMCTFFSKDFEAIAWNVYVKTSYLIPVILGRENTLELYLFYCVSVVPIQKVRTHFNISNERVIVGN